MFYQESEDGAVGNAFEVQVNGLQLKKVRGQHVGDALMAAFLPACEKAGFWKVLSRIFPENIASRALCKKHGFREVGLYEKHARLDGVWKDVVIVEKLLESNLI